MELRELAEGIRRMPETLGRPATRATYVPQLDGLRFVAIAIVIVWHASLRAARHLENAGGTSLYHWFPHGELGVALFFFLSGFVIAEPAFMSGARPMDVRGFWWRRFRRIWPPYVVALTACLGLVAASGFSSPNHGASLLGSYAASVLYLNGPVFASASPIDPPLWSLEIEAQFYLIAPFLLMAYALPRGRARHWLGAVAIVLSLIAMSTITPGVQVEGRFRFGLLTHLDLFLGGIVASGLMAHRLPVGIAARRASADLLMLAGLACMYVLGLWLTAVDARPLGGLPLLATAAATFVATVMVFVGALYGRVTARILSNGWLRLFGTMCFSVYLVHVPVIQAMDTVVLSRLPLHGLASVYAAQLSVGFAASLGAGLVFYVLVERPFMNRRSGTVRPVASAGETRVAETSLAA